MAGSDTSRQGNHFAKKASAAQRPATRPAGSRFAQSAQGPASATSPRPASRTVAPSTYGAANGRKAGGRKAGVPAPHQGRGKKIAIAVGVVLAIVVAVGAYTGITLYSDAKSILAQSQTMMSQASGLKDDIKNGNGEHLKATVNSLANQVSDMKSKTDGPAWTIASLVPVYGDDIRLARGLVTEADNLMQNAAVPASETLANFKLSELIQDGSINVSLFQQLADTLTEVSPTVQQSIDNINALPEAHIGRIKEAVDKIKSPMNAVSEGLDLLNEVAPVLPQMLGADGQTRTYLLVAQNNSELRSTGGFPGSIGTVTVTDGKITMGDFTATADMRWYDAAGFGVTDEEKAIFGDRVGEIPADTNYIPDFPRAMTLLSSMWKDQKGGAVDGVVALDPVFLQSIFKLTGGVTSEGVQVNGDNAARLLLHDAYSLLSTDQQDAFFSAVAAAAAQNLLGNLGSVGMGDLGTTVMDGIKGHRILAWMVNEQEESAMKAIGVGGEVKTDPKKPELGVYVGDDTASKISWYLSTSTQVGAGVKNADGTTTYAVTSTFKNNLTADEAAGQPQYVTGYSTLKRDVTDMYLHIYLFAPAGGSISDVATTGTSSGVTFNQASYNGMQVFSGSPLIDGGETLTVTYNVTVSADAARDMTVRTTPTAQTVAGWQ